MSEHKLLIRLNLVLVVLSILSVLISLYFRYQDSKPAQS
ncbi:hypothetical protein SAMN05421823_11955 [Catalinimonas alkaloidigena]|uniref:Uncharacterized protein n=1 Tax=Catalinimonas alkaloidigena TaxID=1075417 RepID=A0A1G9V8W2_9BACT|nr:hypothetical protein SAMN05421823_11955 [Catalinimonas alkaloidigena]